MRTRLLVPALVIAGAALALGACGSSSRSSPPAGASNGTPAATSPATTAGPGRGGYGY